MVYVEVLGINDNNPEIDPGSSPLVFPGEEAVADRTPMLVAPNLILNDPDNEQ